MSERARSRASDFLDSARMFYSITDSFVNYFREFGLGFVQWRDRNGFINR
jgi:hypothetical protein